MLFGDWAAVAIVDDHRVGAMLASGVGQCRVVLCCLNFYDPAVRKERGASVLDVGWIEFVENGLARRLVAVTGFALAAVMIPVSVLTEDAVTGVLLFCVAVFALELTVGVSWAVTLDIGGEFAGSVSATMNTAGNLAGAFATTLTGYLVTAYGWDLAFFVLAGLAACGALLFLRIDASRSLFAEVQ